jgi:hypothetical protein
LKAVVLLVAAYAAAGWALALVLGAPFRPLIYSRAVLSVTLLIGSVYVGWRCYWLIRYRRPDRLGAALVQDVRERLFTRAQLRAAAPVAVAFLFFMAAFTAFKNMIPLVQPYVWDPSLARLDRTLHFGADPWRILHPILGHGSVTAAVNVVYNLWFLVFFAVLYHQMFSTRDPERRARFFRAFFLTWMVNGTLLAMIFSSAGPCYYGLVAGTPDPFAELNAYLSSSAAEGWLVWAPETQRVLWEAYRSNSGGVGSGISAMPSVHVALAFLFVLMFWREGGWVRAAFTAFFAVILLGSVHLAWHYAVDGYLAMSTTALIWWATGWRTRQRTAEGRALERSALGAA